MSRRFSLSLVRNGVSRTTTLAVVVLCASAAILAVPALPATGQALVAPPGVDCTPSGQRDVELAVPVELQPDFFAAVKTFATANGFDLRITPIGTGGSVAFSLTRSDAEIGGDNAEMADLFPLTFSGAGDHPVAGAAMDRLQDSFALALKAVPGVFAALLTTTVCRAR